MAKFKPVMGSYETILDLFESNEYEVNDRVVQLIIMPYPEIEFEEVEELSDTERGGMDLEVLIFSKNDKRTIHSVKKD